MLEPRRGVLDTRRLSPLSADAAALSIAFLIAMLMFSTLVWFGRAAHEIVAGWSDEAQSVDDFIRMLVFVAAGSWLLLVHKGAERRKVQLLPHT